MAIATNSYKGNCARWNSPADNTDVLPHKSVAVSEHLLQLMAWAKPMQPGPASSLAPRPIRFVRASLPDAPDWAGAHQASASGFLNPQYPIYLSNSSLETGTEYVIRWEFRIGNDRSNILRVTTRATAR